MPAIIVAISSLAMFWAASATWVRVPLDAPVLDGAGFDVPAPYVLTTGFEVTGLTVIASALGLLVAILLVARPADQRSPASILIRNIASLLALIVVGTAFVAAMSLPASDVADLTGATDAAGDPPAAPVSSAAVGGFVFAAFAVAAGTSLAWRKVPATRAGADESRYTVEAVRDGRRGRDEEIDEWDAAVIDDVLPQDRSPGADPSRGGDVT